MADHVAPALEAILMVAEEPLPPALLAKLVGAPINEVEEICENLAAEYIADGRGFILARVAGGYRFQTATEQAPYVERFVLDGQSARLSAAALETLAVIAYKQPVSRNQIASIRGVNVDAVMRTLQQRIPPLSHRILSFQANTSARAPMELVGLAELETEDPELLARQMMEGHWQFGTRFMGGCCGTDTSHIVELAIAHRSSQ